MITDGGIFDDPEPVEIDGDELNGATANNDQSSNLPMTHPGKTHLICVADQQGQPMIARAVADKNGQLQPIENYRRPTQEEFNKIQSRGQVVKQGQVGEVAQTQQTGGSGLTIGKVALAGGVLAASGLGIWYWLRKSGNTSSRIHNEDNSSDNNDDDDDDYDD